MSDAASVLSISPAQVAEWLGMALIAGVGWFARNAFVDLTDQVRAMSSHLAEVNVTLAKHDGSRQLLEQQHDTLGEKVAALEERLRELELRCSRARTGEHRAVGSE